MRKVLKTNNKRELGGLDVLAALTLTMSLAVFGCTTNKYPGSGEPEMSPMKTPTSTPGTSSGTTITPVTMVSSSPDRPSSTDAIAILKANEAYRGKILGPADPGGPQRSESAPPVPAITSGGVESAIVVPTVGSPSVSAASATVSAPSTTTTPVTAITSSGVESAMVVPTAGSPAVTAASATVSAPSATTTITSATAPAGTTVPVITTPLTNTVAVSNRVVTAPSTVTGPTKALPSPGTAPVRATAVTAAATNRTATAGTAAVGTASAPIRVESPGTGVVVTNQSPSLAQRFLRFIGVRRGTTAAPTSGTSTTTTGTTSNPE